MFKLAICTLINRTKNMKNWSPPETVALDCSQGEVVYKEKKAYTRLSLSLSLSLSGGIPVKLDHLGRAVAVSVAS